MIDINTDTLPPLYMIASVLSAGDNGCTVLTKTYEQIDACWPRERVVEAVNKYLAGLKPQAGHHASKALEEAALADMKRMIEHRPWRVSHVNSQLAVCASYGEWLVVPEGVSDTVLVHAARFRSHNRLPVLSYVHPANGAAIMRSSQPLCGLTAKRSVQDERLVAASRGPSPSRLVIVDARSTTSALANAVQGRGSESEQHYDCKKLHLGLPNMHAVREMAMAKAAGDAVPWNRGIERLLDGAARIADLVRQEAACVLVHCSDGWDRTPQLTSLAMLMLDPEAYGNKAGFAALVYREWLHLGHRFVARHAHLQPVDQLDTNECSPIFMQFLDAVKQAALVDASVDLHDWLRMSYNPSGLFMR